MRQTMVTLQPQVHSPSTEAFLARLAMDRSLGRNALVFDRSGVLTSAAFKASAGDRILDLTAGLLPGDIITVETFISGAGGQALFFAPASTMASTAASILFDYAAHRAMVWQQACSFSIYAAGLAKGPVLQQLEKLQQQDRLLA